MQLARGAETAPWGAARARAGGAYVITAPSRPVMRASTLKTSEEIPS